MILSGEPSPATLPTTEISLPMCSTYLTSTVSFPFASNENASGLIPTLTFLSFETMCSTYSIVSSSGFKRASNLAASNPWYCSLFASKLTLYSSKDNSVPLTTSRVLITSPSNDCNPPGSSVHTSVKKETRKK